MTKKVNNTKRKKKKSIKKEKLVTIGFILTIVLLVFIIYKIFDLVIFSNEKYELSGQKYYQYFYGIMEEYSGNMEVFISDDNIQLILEDGQVIYLDSTPIYYKDIMGQVLFADEMEIVIPDIGSYRLNKFTNIIRENKVMYLKDYNKKNKKTIENAFLFDGNNLYFFLERTKITIGEMEYEVSPLSYAIVDYRQSVEIYDYDNEEYTILQSDEIADADVLATSTLGNYTINMGVDAIVTEKSSQLLITNKNNLKKYDEI